MENKQQPEAQMLIDWFEESGGFSQGTKAPHKWVLQAEQELRRQHARIAELESQLEAIGAGGVEPLRKPVVQSELIQAIQRAGFQLLKTPNGYELIKLGQAYAQSAHPAEGVKAQAATLPPLPEPTAFLVCKGSEVTARAWNVDQMRAYAADALAATHPTTQGLDAQIIQALSAGMSIEQWKSSVDVRIGSSDLLGRAIASGEETRIELVRRAVSEVFAAQAKQGG